MNLYILRHGHASADHGSDFHRELDVRGRQEVGVTAARLRSANLQKIVSSPLLRARQTAEIVRHVLALDIDIEEWIEIIPDGDPGLVLSRLEEIPVCSVLLVSHQPLVSSLVELASDEHIYLGTAAVVGIEMDILQARCGRVILQETVHSRR